jgi:antagonist of KipI
MDRIACRAANLLVGNNDGDAVIEATLLGPAIKFEHETLFALAGGDLAATVDGTPIPVWHSVLAPMGSTLRFGQATRGCRTYIAFSGGVDVPLVFGSRSTYLRAAFGGHEGRALRTGDVLLTGAESPTSKRIRESLAGDTARVTIGRWSIGVTLRPQYANDVVVRVLDGAHASLLNTESRIALYGERYRISSSSDRMGYRLEGTSLALETATELMSEGVAFGTVQLPPGGAPIILMADRQTTGGYPRIAEVASIDLPLVAQLKPGDSVRFRAVSLADAQRLYLEQEHDLAQARAAVALRFSSGKK